MYEKTFFKQGATFGGSFTLTDNGTLITGAATNLSSQVTDKSGNVLGTATITESTSSPGTYTLQISASSTASWPISGALFDIKYTDSSGFVMKSNTVELIVQQEVTR